LRRWRRRDRYLLGAAYPDQADYRKDRASGAKRLLH